MSSNSPLNHRTFAANTGLGLKLTPSNSPYPRTPRSPKKTGALYESGLSLKRIIGTTVSSPTAFDCLSSTQVFAYTAGAAAVVVNLVPNEKDGAEGQETHAPTYTQRFFRARPTAVPLVAGSNSTGAPSTPPLANRSTIRDTAMPYTPGTSHTSLDWGDSPSGKTWTSRERIKAATSLSLSRDGKLLAVGETGYCPRVLIYSLQEDSSDTPLAILSEHTFGVRAVAFSPSGAYLASLGSPNDGFLYVWSIHPRTGAAKLHSSNKCTSYIKQMIWLGGNLVTVGTRHIKLWRVEDDGHSRSASPSKPRYALDGTPLSLQRNPTLKTLSGRNVLLGPLVETTFTCVAAISDQKAIICSEKGDICLLDDSDGQKLVKVASSGFHITCLAVDYGTRVVKIGGKNGKTKTMSLHALLTPATPPEYPSTSSHTDSLNEVGYLCAMGFSESRLITIDSKHSIEVSTSTGDVESAPIRKILFPAHGDAVLGIVLLCQPNDRNAVFLTWSANGTVVFWDLEGGNKGSLNVELEDIPGTDDDFVNQCLVVRASESAKFLVTGDKCGVLRIINSATQACVFDARAHISDIQDIAIFEGPETTLVASCSRDRTIQLFREVQEQWELIQTLDDHSASVCSLFFAENGEKLISCSTDRTIHVRQLVKNTIDGEELVAALPIRIITLKASPISMAACLDDHMRNFIVSLLDRTVATYEILSGRLVSSFRAADADGADAVALDALHVGLPSTNGKSSILAGVSSTDKSVRIYDAITGAFLDREWGHTAAVTDVALLETSDSDSKTLISTGSDGTIMIWDLSPRPAEEPQEFFRESSPPKETTSARPPLRRVLSKAELAEFQRASPVTTPTGRSSPPRTIRRKTSRYGLSAHSPTLPPLPSNSKYFTLTSDDLSSQRRGSPRNRSRSPPPSPKARDTSSRRPSLADSRARTKSTGNFSEFGTLNMATEQTCRQLRAYRKRLLSADTVNDEVVKELEQELRLTAIALNEKNLNSKAITESVLSGLLDQYSDRLVSMFDEKLRLGIEPKSLRGETERPKTAGNGSSSSSRAGHGSGSGKF